MKELTLFHLDTCPYCKRARGYMQELCEEDPRYAAIPVKMIEEREQRELADTYDYYYVPCYYIEQEKIAEGDIDKEGVRTVFERVLSAEDN